MGVRVAKFEIWGLKGENRQRWFQLTRDMQEITNTIWQTWLVWHVENDSAAKIRKYLNALAAWRESDKETRGEKPKLSFNAVPSELGKKIRKVLSARFANVCNRPRELLQQSIVSKIGKRKAANGNLSGWMAILLCHESLPSTTRGVPVPFDRQNATIEPPANKDSNYRLHVRSTRIPREGKVATSIEDCFELRTRGRKVAGQVAILRKILSEEYKFCGSSITYDKKNRKWFALICYERDKVENPGLDETKTAVLRPSPNHPWRFRLPSRSLWLGGRGEYVAANRRNLLTQRWSRQANYRYAGTANKGHGRKRALLPIEKLSARWKDFTKTLNHQTTSSTVRICKEHGIGTLVLFQPDGGFRDTRFLVKAGKVEGRHDSTGWDWYQVVTMLQYKCQESGIKLVVRKCGNGNASRFWKEKSQVSREAA